MMEMGFDGYGAFFDGIRVYAIGVGLGFGLGLD